MGIIVSEKAAQEVQRAMGEMDLPEGTMLRVGVAGGGCSGFSYSLAFEQNIDEDHDDVYEFHGVKVVVDRKSDLYLDGTSLEFHDGLERRGFFFNNPKAVKTCGCGSSFSV